MTIVTTDKIDKLCRCAEGDIDLSGTTNDVTTGAKERCSKERCSSEPAL
jgi:hypothetical protein